MLKWQLSNRNVDFGSKPDGFGVFHARKIALKGEILDFEVGNEDLRGKKPNWDFFVVVLRFKNEILGQIWGFF